MKLNTSHYLGNQKPSVVVRGIREGRFTWIYLHHSEIQ